MTNHDEFSHAEHTEYAEDALRLECSLIECAPRFTFMSWSYFAPWSIVLLTLTQIIIFYVIEDQSKTLSVRLKLKPGDEYRLITCILAHSDASHLWGNMLIQLVVGGWLELEEGTRRVQLIYWASGVAASLSEAALFQPTTTQSYINLLGASGAIYGLLLVGLAIVIMNFRETSFAACIVLFYLLAIALEVYLSIQSSASNIAYTAHAVGAIFGFLLGILFVRNLKITRLERLITLWTTILVIVSSALLIYFGLGNYAS